MDDAALLIVTLSTVFSVILALLATSGESFLSHGERPDFQLVIGLAIFSVSAASSVAGIALVWTGAIGFDALAVAIAGLIPALQALMIYFPSIFARVLMMKMSKSLDPTVRNFKYARFDYLAELYEDPLSTQWNIRFHTKRICYVHFESSQNLKKEIPGKSENSMPDVWWGTPMDDALVDSNKRSIDCRAPKLRDKANGKSFVWWRSIVTGSNIVAKPHEFGLQGPFHAIRALSALADIVIIGDAIFECHGPHLERTFEDRMDAIYDMNGTSATCSDDFQFEKHMESQAWRHRVEVSTLVCNSIISFLHLDDWNTADYRRFPKNNLSLNARAGRYATLFFMIALYSNLFQKSPRVSGADIMHVLLDEKSLEPLVPRLCEKTSTWLQAFDVPLPTDDSDKITSKV